MFTKSARLRREIANKSTSDLEADLPVVRSHNAVIDRLEHRICLLCSPLILVIIAGTQLYNAHFLNLAPGEGGGFGMFSTADNLGNRLVRCTLITDRGEFPIEVPARMSHLLRKATSIPTAGLLSDFARQLGSVNWEPFRRGGTASTLNGSGASAVEYGMAAKGEGYEHPQLNLPLEAGGRATVVGVRVEVMRLVFDAQEHRLNAEMILAVTENRKDQAP